MAVSLRYNNPLTVVDLFCGAGIGAIGAVQAGLKTIYAVDNNPHAVATYNHNFDHQATCANIEDISEFPYADIVTGGFPCLDFSFAGSGDGAGGVHGSLSWHYVRAVASSKPKAFLLENVAGLVSKTHKSHYRALKTALSDIGYVLSEKLVDCSMYGLPQRRERIFVVGIRKDLDRSFIFPSYTGQKINIRRAVGDLPDPTAEIPDHMGVGIRKDEAPFIEHVPIGGNWKDLPITMQLAFMGKCYILGGGKTGYLRKIAFDGVANTITSTISGKFNAQIVDNRDKYKDMTVPQACRRFTVRECLRLQGVPDSFRFPKGVPTAKKYERCSGIPTPISKLFLSKLRDTLR